SPRPPRGRGLGDPSSQPYGAPPLLRRRVQHHLGVRRIPLRLGDAAPRRARGGVLDGVAGRRPRDAPVGRAAEARTPPGPPGQGTGTDREDALPAGPGEIVEWTDRDGTLRR